MARRLLVTVFSIFWLECIGEKQIIKNTETDMYIIEFVYKLLEQNLPAFSPFHLLTSSGFLLAHTKTDRVC